MDLGLTELKECTLVEGSRLQRNHQYRPESAKLPTVGSLIPVHSSGEPSSILLTFQIARNKSGHNVIADGLRNVDDSSFSSNSCGCCVVATPEGTRLKIMVPMIYFLPGLRHEIVRTSPDKVFSMFHYPISKKELFPYDHICSR